MAFHLRETQTELAARLHLSDFQLRLLQEFTLILLGNALLVLVAWKLYGPRISGKFLRERAPGADRKEVENLRTGIDELKLPREQDFRVK